MHTGQLDQPSHPCEVCCAGEDLPQAHQPWRDDAGTATRVKSGDALIAELSPQEHFSNMFPHPPALSDQIFSFPGLPLLLPTSLLRSHLLPVLQ